jgi:predicted glycoside hydrolase/deacetylase ChbG (UPF0249 family)
VSGSNPPRAARLLGYPDDARLLILNADDFGMCRPVNQAIVGVLRAGVVRSTSLMVPCPAAAQAIRYLAEHPAPALGVHLTAISDSAANRWRPLTPTEQVTTLVDRDGFFHPFDHMPAVLAQVELAQLEMELLAQIEAALAAGLHPSHLDWHALRIDHRPDIFNLMTRLARTYGLALRVRGSAVIENLLRQGLPVAEFDFLDSSSIIPAAQPAEYARLLHELPIGLSEWAVHPGLGGPELLALEPGGSPFRQVDYDFWTSPEARSLVEQEGVILVDYRALQAVWQQG